MSKTILVTGGAGFIGSHTVVELLHNGYEVAIIDNLSNSKLDVLKGIHKITGSEPKFQKIDIRYKDELTQYFQSHGPFDGIIHFAALKAVGESVLNPLLYYQNNIAGLCNLLECVDTFKIPNFIFSSSCTVYGNPDQLPVTEKTPIGKTESPYGYSKVVSEKMIDDFTNSQEIVRAISLRYFNPVGAHPSGLIGELPTGVPNNLMPYITQTAMGLRPELKVFGSDYNTPDGTAIRDYIHVVDLAKAHLDALHRLENGKSDVSHEFFNIGTGHGYSVLEVIQSFERSTGQKVPYRLENRRQGDVEAIYADVSLATEVLDWQATLGIDDMTSSAWQWQINMGA